MNKLPKHLEQIVEKEAKKTACIGDDDQAIMIGASFLYEYLITHAEDEFDKEAARAEYIDNYRLEPDLFQSMQGTFVAGTKWQHSQSQATIVALKAEIEELKEYKSMYEGLCK